MWQADAIFMGSLLCRYVEWVSPMMTKDKGIVDCTYKAVLNYMEWQTRLLKLFHWGLKCTQQFNWSISIDC